MAELNLVELSYSGMMTWRSIRRKPDDGGEVIYPNLLTVLFHDLRHTAITVMAEAGLPDHIIMVQAEHVSPEMIKHYRTFADKR